MTTSAYLKAGLQGGTGSGKTQTAALLLLAISKELCHSAPVMGFDTEPGWQFVKPIFDAEGVPLLIESGRHFKGMYDALQLAIKEGCCGFAVDSITHPWQELLERFADSTGRVPFHKFNQIKPMWSDWTTEFLNAPMHCIANGRLAFDYFYEEAEDGRRDVVKGDAKMKAGGGESFGYEPHLLCELSHERTRRGGKLRGLEYHCLVLKDRSRALNGKEFLFADEGGYKAGGYKHVFKAFRPHLDALAAIAQTALPKTTSAELVSNGDSSRATYHRECAIAYENIEATFTKLMPGQDAKSRALKIAVMEEIFSTRSKLKIETMPLATLEAGLKTLYALESRLRTETPADEAQMSALVRLAKMDITAPSDSGEPPAALLTTTNTVCARLGLTLQDSLDAAETEESAVRANGGAR